MAWAAALALAVPLIAGGACQQQPPNAPIAERAALLDGAPLASEQVWNDGYSEMSYYDATAVIYGVERNFTRVHMLNRQMMDIALGVKSDQTGPGHVAVWKMNIAEQIPTENYNYRFLTQVFLERADLAPFVLTVSSQEWCGATFKKLRWDHDADDGGLTVRSSSYFPNEGDREWRRPADAFPHAGLALLARAAVAAGDAPREDIALLPSLHSNRQVVPDTMAVRVVVASETSTVDVPAGRFEARRVSVGDAWWFDVEATAPFRLLALDDGVVSGELRFVERRPYWDRSSASDFHAPSEAP